MSKSYCYNVRDALNGNKLVGGMLHADSLEEAAKLAIKTCGLTLRITGTQAFTRIKWVRNGRMVYLHVTVHAEYYLDDEAKRKIQELPIR